MLQGAQIIGSHRGGSTDVSAWARPTKWGEWRKTGQENKLLTRAGGGLAEEGATPIPDSPSQPA